MHLTGKELVIKAFHHEDISMPPWIPFAGVHAGKLKGHNATEVLTDGEKLLASLLEVNKLYSPDGQPVIFDLQVEAEILGCDLTWAEKAPASVSSHPLSKKLVIPTKLPEKSDGRLPMILDVMKKMKEQVGTTTALFGLICGPFTLASHLRGNDIFMDMFDEPETLKELLAYTTKVNMKMAEIYMEVGMDVIAIVDPLVSQISPIHFHEFLGNPFTKVFSFIRENNTLSSFFVCGNATRNIEEMCLSKPDSIFIDENVDMIEAKKITDQYNITLGGNIPLTSIMLHGTQQDNMKYVVELIDQLTPLNLTIAPGCDMPYDIPPENVIAIQQAIRQPNEVRELLKNYEATEEDLPIELPDYEHLKQPLIEVFTLDSATCAACTYMLGAVLEAGHDFGTKVDIIEYKFTEKENIARVKKMGITNLPCIYINGKLKFSSIIPSKKEIYDAIKESFL